MVVSERVHEQDDGHRREGEVRPRSSRRRSTASATAPATIDTVSSGTSAAIPSRPTTNVEWVASQTWIGIATVVIWLPIAEMPVPNQSRRNGLDVRSGRTSTATRESRASRPGRSSGSSSRRAGLRPRSARSPRAGDALAGRGRRGRRARSRSAGAAAPRARRPGRRAATRSAESPPISATIVRSVREAMIGSATPSTQTLVRAPCPRCLPRKRLERVDLVGPRELAEAEEDHPRCPRSSRGDYRSGNPPPPDP